MKKTWIRQRGFTLIELMIVIAIVSILAVIALASYQTYIVKAQIAEAMELLGGIKLTVGEFHSSKGHWPPDNGAAGIAINAVDIHGKYVQQVEVGKDLDGGVLPGAITATMRSTGVAAVLRGKKVTLRPTPPTGASYVWSCVSDVEAKYLPSVCRP
ncbi:pilin [Cardiobacterium valvarum]|uniref:Pilin n=1 Tax=Cardiobacterium valvarum TaxID=194702 RepID=A0A381EDU1_9GAMM|nr:pilin [Cardiobacterium valvarum]SUX25146.1 Pilin [Cardiobacterium valvarum]